MPANSNNHEISGKINNIKKALSSSHPITQEKCQHTLSAITKEDIKKYFKELHENELNQTLATIKKQLNNQKTPNTFYSLGRTFTRAIWYRSL